MDIKSGLTAVDIFYQTGGRIKIFQYDIGAWNMQASGTKQVTLTGLTEFDKIQACTIMINHDNGTNKRAYGTNFILTLNVGVNVEINSGTGIATLTRDDASDFNSANYNDAVMNRGHLLIFSKV